MIAASDSAETLGMNSWARSMRPVSRHLFSLLLCCSAAIHLALPGQTTHSWAAMHVLKTPRLRVGYLDQGAGPRTVVLLHGNFASANWWQRTLKLAPGGIRLIAPSMRGCGASSAPRPISRIKDLADDVISFLEALDVSRCTVVGHSLGGAIAIELAVLRPDLVSRLELIAPAPGDRLESIRGRSTTLGRAMRLFNPDVPGSRWALVGLLHLGHAFGTVRSELRRGLANMMPTADMSAAEFDALLEDAMTMDPAVVARLYNALHRWDAREGAGHVRVPTRILAGGKDALVPRETLELLAEQLKVGLEVWPDVGHSPMIEQPAAFVDWLLEAPKLRAVAST